jgi:hypothetical protein
MKEIQREADARIDCRLWAKNVLRFVMAGMSLSWLGMFSTNGQPRKIAKRYSSDI